MLDLLIYVVLLLPFHYDLPKWFDHPSLHAALKRVSYKLELVDPTETWYESFPWELKRCWTRSKNMFNSPPSIDVCLLPEFGYALNQVRIADRFCSDVEKRLLWNWSEYERAGLEELLCEAQRRKEIWYIIHHACANKKHIYWSRWYLHQLRDKAPAAYHSGRWPAAIPIEWLVSQE